MKTHIRLYRHEGWQWLGFVSNGVLHLITKLGRIGDCVRP